MNNKTNSAIETDYTDWPTCPKCGHVHCDAWEWHDNDGETECEAGCGQVFEYSRNVSVSYSTKRVAK